MGAVRRVAPWRQAGLDTWVRGRFFRHRGNTEVVRQELSSEVGVEASLRTVERAAPHRRQLRTEAKATLRFETPPGRPLQIDFGEARVPVGGERVRTKLFVATLGYSRRAYADAFGNQRQSSWFAGLEGAFRHFGGVPEEVLTRCWWITRSRWWRSTTRRRARWCSKRQVPGVRGALGLPSEGLRAVPGAHQGEGRTGRAPRQGQRDRGREFESLEALRGHLAWWQREIADKRRHCTTGETPMERFGGEAERLRPCAGRRPLRDLIRRVRADCAVTVDANAYSVPWRLIGERVRVVVCGGRVRVHRGAEVVADHAEHAGRRARIVERAHLAGVNAGPRREAAPSEGEADAKEPALLRPLDEYATAAGGRF